MTTTDDLYVGQIVYKPKGYPFIATIVAEFEKLDGERRVVAESHMIPGLLHIFAPHQLAPIPPLQYDTPRVEADDLDAWLASTPVGLFTYEGGTIN